MVHEALLNPDNIMRYEKFDARRGSFLLAFALGLFPVLDDLEKVVSTITLSILSKTRREEEVAVFNIL